MPLGGKPGAKPKPAGEKYQAVTLRLHPRDVKLLRALAKRMKLSQGEMVSAALRAMESTK
jgi:hypothetical protein